MNKHYSHGSDKKHWNDKNNDRNKNSNKDKNTVNDNTLQENKKENDFVLPKITLKTLECSYCKKPIEDLVSALSSRENGSPVHYECVIEKLKNEEKLEKDEKITYIGQGKFGIIHFENPLDTKHFTIRKTIEWEKAENEKSEWRKEITTLYTSIK